jgi:hypothetical protein
MPDDDHASRQATLRLEHGSPNHNFTRAVNSERMAVGFAQISAASAYLKTTNLRRSEFAITDTELRLIAAAATIGLSSKPKAG